MFKKKIIILYYLKMKNIELCLIFSKKTGLLKEKNIETPKKLGLEVSIQTHQYI